MAVGDAVAAAPRSRCLVGEPDVAELDAAGVVAAATGLGGETIVGLGIEQLEDALAGGHGGLQDVVLVAEVLDGAEEALRVLHEGDQDAEGDGAAERTVAHAERLMPPRQMTRAMAVELRNSTAG